MTQIKQMIKTRNQKPETTNRRLDSLRYIPGCHATPSLLKSRPKLISTGGAEALTHKCTKLVILVLTAVALCLWSVVRPDTVLVSEQSADASDQKTVTGQPIDFLPFTGIPRSEEH